MTLQWNAVPLGGAGGKPAIPIKFAGLVITLDGSGAAYIEASRTLIVSDLHLEKGSASAAKGRLLPSCDSWDTLIRFQSAIEAYRPVRVICLGDSFHDGQAGERMAARDRSHLRLLRARVAEWIWIAGNHDPHLPAFCREVAVEEIKEHGAICRHVPDAKLSSPQIAGHLHPKTAISAGGFRLGGRCFCVSRDLLIMPAFGAYAGGLSCNDPAIAELHKSEPEIFMIYGSKLWRVA